MEFTKAYIPYKGYWSTPFSKWQMSLQNLHAIRLAGQIGSKWLEDRMIPASTFDGIVLGMTIPQTSCFYGAPWLAGELGCPDISGPTIGQACATGATTIEYASRQVETDYHGCVIVVTADRCSNGPHLYYPKPIGPGGTGDSEDWVMDNFGNDPYAKNAMIETAENVAKENNIDREVQDEVALMRFEQYQAALKNDGEFHRRFMVPVDVNPTGRKVVKTVTSDEGVFPTTKEGLAALKPVMKGGTVTFGSQTHPADGNCGIIVTTKEKARELSQDKAVTIQVISYGKSRVKKGFMGTAVVPAAQQAIERAGVGVKDLKAIKTHNPFAVNDVYMSRQMDIPLDGMNNYGSSMIWGHPQGPTGSRLVIELIEELVMLGGGTGLFAGCAAGDTAGAIVVKVSAG